MLKPQFSTAESGLSKSNYDRVVKAAAEKYNLWPPPKFRPESKRPKVARSLGYQLALAGQWSKRTDRSVIGLAVLPLIEEALRQREMQSSQTDPRKEEIRILQSVYQRLKVNIYDGEAWADTAKPPFMTVESALSKEDYDRVVKAAAEKFDLIEPPKPYER